MTLHMRLRLGSRRNRYGWFPPQLLIMRSSDRLNAVLPSEIENTDVGIEQFLEALLRGDAWSLVPARKRADQGPHRTLVDAIVANPDRLEAGLALRTHNAWVADGGGETGYIDLVFVDGAGWYWAYPVSVDGIGLW